MTLEELYKQGTAKLAEVGIEYPSVDAFYLLEHAAGLNRTSYLMYKDQQVSDRNIAQYMGLIERRMTRIPYQYITGVADFAGLNFEVNPDVLIPRLDTEVLFEQALRCLGKDAYVLDMCTGSGALGIALKRYRPDIHMVLSDISPKALKVARANIEHNHMEVAKSPLDMEHASADPSHLECGYDLNFGIRVIESDLFDNMCVTGSDSNTEPAAKPLAQSHATADAPVEKKEVVGQFDVLVCNPPYVTDSEYESLMPEVKEHEPKLALTAGADGLEIYRRIAADAGAFLKEDAVMLLEIGCSQAQAVSDLLKEHGYTDIKVVKDLAELDRVIICRLKRGF